MICDALTFMWPDFNEIWLISVYQGTLGLTLKEVRPTVFGGVPRVWEKIMEKMQETAKSVTGLKRKIGIWAKGVGLQGAYAKINGYVFIWPSVNRHVPFSRQKYTPNVSTVVPTLCQR